MAIKVDDNPAFPIPAFPCDWIDRDSTGEQVVRQQFSGLSAREYAAIHLRVPNSGVEWLDDMIRKAKRDEIAERVACHLFVEYRSMSAATVMGLAYLDADAMIKEGEK